MDRARKRRALFLVGVLTVAVEVTVALAVAASMAEPVRDAVEGAAGSEVAPIILRGLVNGFSTTVALPLVVLLVIAFVRALTLPPLYALAREPPGATVRSLAIGVRRLPRTAGSAALARATTLAAAPVAFVTVGGPLLALLTLGQYSWYAVWPTARWLPDPVLVAFGLLVAVTGLLAVAGLPVAFADVACFGGAGLRRAVSESVRTIRRSPRAFARYALARFALGTVVLVAAGGLVLVSATDADGPGISLPVGLVIAGGAARSFGVGVHVTAAEELASASARADGGPSVTNDERPTVGSDDGGGRGRRAVVVAALLTAPLVLGGAAAAVRVADERPWGSPPPAPVEGDESAASLLATAREQVHERSVTVTARFATLNETTGQVRNLEILRHRVDRPSHGVRTVIRNDGSDRPTERIYVGDGVWAARGSGSWFSVSVPLYASLHRGVATDPWLPAPDSADWVATHRKGPRVVLQVTGSEVKHVDVASVGRRNVSGDSYVRVTIDTATGRVRRVVADVATVGEEREHSRTEITYAYGTSVSRPDRLGGPGAAELFWDALYY